MVTKSYAQSDLVKGISEIAASIPLTRRIQLYEFALFLETRPLPDDEVMEAFASDEALWDAQFAATSDEKLASLIRKAEAEINAGETQQMFDDRGEFIERK